MHILLIAPKFVDVLNASQRTSDHYVQKELAKAGLSAGQRKITDTFFATSSCVKGVHGGNATSNVSVRSPDAKDVDTNKNLNTGDGITNSENNMGLDFARSTCDASVSISRNTSGSYVNDFDPKLCCVFGAKKLLTKVLTYPTLNKYPYIFEALRKLTMLKKNLLVSCHARKD